MNMTEPLTECVIECEDWGACDLPALAHRAARATFAHLGLPEEGFTLCVMGCDDARSAVLNAGFRGKAQPTNVLSWPSRERGAAQPGAQPERPSPGPANAPESLGDIAMSYQTCAREAAAAATPFTDHVTHLIVHGILHLLGYDHVNDADAMVMEKNEVDILCTLGIDSPYS